DRRAHASRRCPVAAVTRSAFRPTKTPERPSKSNSATDEHRWTQMGRELPLSVSICVHLWLGMQFFSLLFVSWWFPLIRQSAAHPANRAPIALTFDLGGDAEPVPAILRALRAARVRATFFVTGRWAAAHPRLLRRIAGGGHALGNHTDSHRDLTRLPDTRIAGELRRAEARIWRACGRTPRPLFRPPFGAWDARVRRIAAAMGYR